MKKIIIGVLLIFSGLLGYSQIPDITPPVLFQNQQSYGAIRGIINTNANNFASYANRLRDSIATHNLRLRAIEKDTATYGTGGGGTGSTYIFSNGLTETNGTVSLGGNISSNTYLTTGNNLFRLRNLSSSPLSGNYSYMNFSGTGLSIYSTAVNPAIVSGSTLDINNEGFTLWSKDAGTGVEASIGRWSGAASGLLFQYDVGTSGNYRTLTFDTQGLKYGGDYSSNYTDRSLVDKGYLDDQINGLITEIPVPLYVGLNDGDTAIDLRLTNSRGIHIVNSTSGAYDAIEINNSSSNADGNGIELNNSGSGAGIGFKIYNGSLTTGDAVNINNESAGDAIDIYNKYGATGTALKIRDETAGNAIDLTIDDGNGLYITNSFGGNGIYVDQAISGTAISIANRNGTAISIFDVTSPYPYTNLLTIGDSLWVDYLGLSGLSAGSVWFTNTPTGAVDTAHTEPSYIGWEMKDLPTLEEYEKDVKMINGHMERRVWYIDYETKELKSQYGWDGLGMMNTQSAYMIYHEITVRWMFEQNKKLEQNKRSALKRKVKSLEERLETIEKLLSFPSGVTTLEHRR